MTKDTITFDLNLFPIEPRQLGYSPKTVIGYSPAERTPEKIVAIF